MNLKVTTRPGVYKPGQVDTTLYGTGAFFVHKVKQMVKYVSKRVRQC